MEQKEIRAWIRACSSPLIIIVGGILSYFLIERSNVLLNATKIQLDQIELNVKSLKEELNINEKQLKLSSDILEIIKDIIPSVKIDNQKPEWQASAKKFTYCAELFNTGKLPFILCDINTTEPPNIPYDIIIFPSLPPKGPEKIILPGQSCKYYVTLEFKDTLPTLYEEYTINYKVRTVDSVINAISSYLKDVISEKEIRRISEGTYSSNFRFDRKE